VYVNTVNVARHPWYRFQYSLRGLFAFTTVVAIYFSIAYTVGYIEASGTLMAGALLVSAAMCRHWGRWPLGVLGIGLLWFVAMDRSVFFEHCDDCDLIRYRVQIRVFHIPVAEKTMECNTLISRIAEDLGEPCAHRFQGYQKYRFWGLIYPAYPCIDGIDRLTAEEDWYDDQAREFVRTKASTSPSSAKEFSRRAIFGHDYVYRWTFIDELKQSFSCRNKEPEPEQ
jgi:hypothetical protein